MPIRLTQSIKILLIVCGVVYLIQHTAERFFGIPFSLLFGLVPEKAVLNLWIWQLFTYSFLHGPPWHLFFNLLMLAFIGSEIEGVWGRLRFLRFYGFCVLFSGLIYLFAQVFVTGGLEVPMVGASGGIFGLLLAYGILFGDRVMLFMMLFPMKAKHFIWILAGIEFMTLLYVPGGGLASLAHLAGMVGGFAYLLVEVRLKKRVKGARAKRVKKKPDDNKHLKLVINNVKNFDDDTDPDRNSKTWH